MDKRDKPTNPGDAERRAARGGPSAMKSGDAPEKAREAPQDREQTQGAIGRRDFVKLLGGTGVALTAGVLAGDNPAAAAEAEPSTVPYGKVVGPGPTPITLR